MESEYQSAQMRLSKQQKVKFTTYLPRLHKLYLEALSDLTGRPITAMIAEALDDFFVSVGMYNEQDKVIPPAEKDFYRSALDVFGLEELNEMKTAPYDELEKYIYDKLIKIRKESGRENP